MAVSIYNNLTQNKITQRRKEEYKILYSLSVPPKKMRRLCLSSSLLLLPLCFAILLLTIAATAVFSYIFNSVLPNVFHISASIVGSVALPLWVYSVILAALFLCFLLSFLIPYFCYRSIKRSFAAKP